MKPFFMLNSTGHEISLGHKNENTKLKLFFFMLNSAEHGICPANKSQITDNCKFFLAKHS